MSSYDTVRNAYNYLSSKEGQEISVKEIKNFTGWAPSTIKTYISKKWRSFIKKQPNGKFRIDGISKLTQEEFCKLHTQVTEAMTIDEVKTIIKNHKEIVINFIRDDLTESEVIALAYRKKELDVFARLLNDSAYFDTVKKEHGIRGLENVWQSFFEKNPWIFGYGLNYFFNSSLDEKKLEQVVAGFNFSTTGKRVDALMKTRGLISSICFGEIKIHTTKLLKRVKNPYRSDCWAVSDELAGGLSQLQKTVQKAINDIETEIRIHDKEGNPTGEQLYLYQPKSFLVIGHLNEFISEHGVNEEKFSSFELFRKNLINPEIITFDELYERAKYIVKSTE